MNLNDQTFNLIFSTQNALKDHFEQIFQSLSIIASKSSQDLNLYSKFIDSQITNSSQFEKSINRACEDFQTAIFEAKIDQNIVQNFQQLNSSFLRLGSHLNKINFVLTENKLKIIQLAKTRTNILHSSVNSACNQSNLFKSALSKFESDYRKFIKCRISCPNFISNTTNNTDVQSKLPQSEINDINNAIKVGSLAQKSFFELSNITTKNFDMTKNRLEDLSNNDLSRKIEIAQSIENLTKTIELFNYDSVLSKNHEINDLAETQKSDFVENQKSKPKKSLIKQESSIFKITKSDQNLNFVLLSDKETDTSPNRVKSSENIQNRRSSQKTKSINTHKNDNLFVKFNKSSNQFKSLLTLSLLSPKIDVHFQKHINIFPDYNFFLTNNYILEQFSLKQLLSKTSKLSTEVSARSKIVIETLSNFFWTKNTEFCAEYMNELSIIMSKRSSREFFVLTLIIKKCFFFQSAPFSNILLKKRQFRNLQSITQYFFTNYIDLSLAEFELIFDYIKLLACVFSKRRNGFLETCSKIFIFNDLNFWLGLFDFLIKSPIEKSSDLTCVSKESTNPPIIDGIKLITDIFKPTPPIELKIDSSTKIFDNLVSVIFRLKLDFEAITDILIELASKAKIDLEHVKLLLMRNQDLLLTQVSFLTHKNSIGDEYINFFEQPQKPRFYTLICLLLPFIENPSDLINLIHVSKETNSKKTKIFSNILTVFNFEKYPNFRKMIYIFLSRNSKIIENKIEFKENNMSNLISLDMNRTFSKHPKFNSIEIEKILNNLSNSNGGNFSYYQGLNYVVSYFYIFFDGQSQNAYDVVLWLIRRDFIHYFDKELKNVRKLFFYLKRLLKRNLPILSNYLEIELKIDTDIIFAAWCLTLFTTVTQSEEKCALLDEIIDLFVGIGWVGFFKAVLSLLSELEENILKMKFDEVLLTLGDLAKNNFSQILTQKSKDFSFKKAILKFKKVTKDRIKFYEKEYERKELMINSIWEKIDVKINENK